MITTYNNNLSPLPFYTNISEQNHRLSYAYGNIYPLYGHTSFLLPFQIMRTHRNDTISFVKVYDREGLFVTDLTSAMGNAGLSITAFSSYGIDVISFPAVYSMATGLEEGQYYLELSDGVDTWYSDILTLADRDIGLEILDKRTY